MKKSELKSIIKECIIEVLSEGLTSSQQSIVEGRQTYRPFQQSQQRQQQRPIVDKQQRLQQQKNPVLEQTIKAAARGNSSLADILADTANTTLQRQLSADKGMHAGFQNEGSDGMIVIPNADLETQVMANSEPTDIFGAASKNWAELAFAPRKPQ